MVPTNRSDLGERYELGVPLEQHMRWLEKLGGELANITRAGSRKDNSPVVRYLDNWRVPDGARSGTTQFAVPPPRAGPPQTMDAVTKKLRPLTTEETTKYNANSKTTGTPPVAPPNSLPVKDQYQQMGSRVTALAGQVAAKSKEDSPKALGNLANAAKSDWQGIKDKFTDPAVVAGRKVSEQRAGAGVDAVSGGIQRAGNAIAGGIKGARDSIKGAVTRGNDVLTNLGDKLDSTSRDSVRDADRAAKSKDLAKDTPAKKTPASGPTATSAPLGAMASGPTATPAAAVAKSNVVGWGQKLDDPFAKSVGYDNAKEMRTALGGKGLQAGFNYSKGDDGKLVATRATGDALKTVRKDAVASGYKPPPTAQDKRLEAATATARQGVADASNTNFEAGQRAGGVAPPVTQPAQPARPVDPNQPGQNYAARHPGARVGPSGTAILSQPNPQPTGVLADALKAKPVPVAPTQPVAQPAVQPPAVPPTRPAAPTQPPAPTGVPAQPAPRPLAPTAGTVQPAPSAPMMPTRPAGTQPAPGLRPVAPTPAPSALPTGPSGPMPTVGTPQPMPPPARVTAPPVQPAQPTPQPAVPLAQPLRPQVQPVQPPARMPVVPAPPVGGPNPRDGGAGKQPLRPQVLGMEKKLSVRPSMMAYQRELEATYRRLLG